jgi:hypothetical protein
VVATKGGDSEEDDDDLDEDDYDDEDLEDEDGEEEDESEEEPPKATQTKNPGALAALAKPAQKPAE